MSVSELIQACALVTAMLGAIAMVIQAGRYTWRWMRKLAQMADDLTGELPRAGLPLGRKGVLARLDGIESRLDKLDDMERRLAAVEAQLQPNGGNTFRDAVDRIGIQTQGIAQPPTEPVGE